MNGKGKTGVRAKAGTSKRQLWPKDMRLARLAKSRRTSRNAFVRKTLADLVEHGEGKKWPREVLDFQGIRSVKAFEASRRIENWRER